MKPPLHESETNDWLTSPDTQQTTHLLSKFYQTAAIALVNQIDDTKAHVLIRNKILFI